MNPQPIIHIIADDREAQSGVIEALQQTPNVEVQIQRLTTGDYQIERRWCFERKTLPDFAQSIIDTRLFTQAKRMANSSLATAIILEGSGNSLAHLNVRREAIQGAMISLSLIFGIPILRSMDPAETARVMIYAARQLSRHEACAFPSNRKRAKSKRKIQTRILQAMPGIGPKLAETLIGQFGNVQSVMSASEEDLQKIEGIGKKTANGIRMAVQEEIVPYQA